MFFNKLKPIILDFYTFDTSAFEYAQPSMNKTRPKWLSSMCPVISRQKDGAPLGVIETYPTVAYCPAIRDFISGAINIPSWYETDLIISGHSWTDTKGPGWNERIEPHSHDQLGGSFYKDRLLLKLVSPWKGICTEDINFMYLQNFYGSEFFSDNDIIIPPGYTNFKYQNSTNIHLWARAKEETYNINIPIATPLLSLVPMTERKIKIRNHLVNFAEWLNMGSPNPKVSIGAYYKKLKMLKERLK